MAAADDSVAQPAGVTSQSGDEAIRDEELDALLAPLSSFRTLILAVSGGADSMALMHLVRRWSQRRADAPAIVVATVDHGLRAGSRGEAEQVVREARTLGLTSELLTWTGEKPATGVQDAARAARYRLLCELARARGALPAAIVTAHTEDDQAETLLMRLARGSGIDGLAAIPIIRAADAEAPEVALVRPLLGVSGARLRATLRAAGRTWIEDPSNDADRFERVRLRKARGLLEELGLENDKLALSARRLARARAALDAAVAELQARARLDEHAGAFASFDFAAWRRAPEELRLRLLGRLVALFGGRAAPLRLAQLEALAARMAGGAFEGATLAGAVVAERGGIVHVQREWGRDALPTLRLDPGSRATWDHRFRVAAAPESPGAVEVRALGAAGFAQLRQQLRGAQKLPASAAATLPAFWRGEELLFVPALADAADRALQWGAAQRLYSAEFLG